MKRIAWLATLPLLALPALALAADGYTTGNVNLLAGPDPSYPLIDTIPAGAPLDVQGCTSGWEWCDVIFQDERGWVAGNFIQYDYDNQYVLVPQYGVQIGIPIVTFVISSYWDSYYRDRPFYRERSRWYARPMPHRPPPPPMHRAAPPQHGNLPHGNPPRQPERPLPDRNPQPMPQQRPHMTPAPSPEMRPAVPSRVVPATRPGNGRPTPEHGKPAPAQGKPASKDKHDQQDH
ncbi:MAG TPA: SH3 domain-containing protein [Rhodanobacter sp.]|nr:SH3 domain-containing protein [Rhodanobacter sp.]